MEEKNVQKILKYYLEYEIYNIANSSQIKINNKTSILMMHNDILDIEKFSKNINSLKEGKLKEQINKFIGKRVTNKDELVKEIINELDNLDDEQSNIAQISFLIQSLIKEEINYEIKEKTIENFSNKLCEIKTNNDFWLYAHNMTSTSKLDRAKKIPIFILRCELNEDNIKVLEANVNEETLNKILSILLNKEISEVAIEYKDRIVSYAKEIKLLIDAGDLDHILDLFYSKMNEYLGITKDEIMNISKINDYYNANYEYIISIEELSEDGVKNIKEDIELLNKLIEDDGYIPSLLNKYLNGGKIKKNINDTRYKKPYLGNYKSEYGVGENQYKIVNSLKDNDLITVEGPPGTGKTSLLKEIIANNIVERADLILKNWNKEFKRKKFYGTNYYDIQWFNNTNVVKSIVVSSKNGEAIENVGKEINREIEYMYSIAKEYKRTETIKGKKQKVLQEYKGIVCLPLGKQDNVLDFKEFLYQKLIPFLEEVQKKEIPEELIKNDYKNKRKEIKEFENLIELLEFDKTKDEYFYGMETQKFETKEEKEERIRKIRRKFLIDKEKTSKEFNELEKTKNKLKEEKKEKEKELKQTNKKIKNIKEKINGCQNIIAKGNSNIDRVLQEKKTYEEVSRNFFTKILNYNFYKNNKNKDFLEIINRIKEENETQRQQKTNYINEKFKLEQQKDNINSKINELEEKYNSIGIHYRKLNNKIRKMDFIERFNEFDKNTYWDYNSTLQIYGKSRLNDLNQELFQLALKLNELYIIKNSKEIIENLKIFLSNEDVSYICKKFFDSTEIYNEERQEGIRSLWNTLFLCFPVVTTTLDSFTKRFFQLIPEYIDLELIDEAGQILPHNLVSAIYRAKKAVIVGDVNQIEPIYHNLNKNFVESEKSIGDKFEIINVEKNSIQSLASKNTDILDNGENIILNEHYRCEKNIVNFSNENIYNKKLNMNIPDNMDKPFLNNMIFFDVRGKKPEKRNVNINILEVESCIEVVKYIKEKNSKSSIAIITPFKMQKNELEDRLEKEGFEDIKVGTVHAFQGQEKDYIIFSPVIDNIEERYYLNFIGGKGNMLNVAVTRAKKQFIYLGNFNVAMQAGNYITKLAKYIKENGAVYSLFDDETFLKENWDAKILKILAPELKEGNDKIGVYIKQNIKEGIIVTPQQHYEFLKYVLKNAEKEVYIMSPWLRENVINIEFLNDIKELKERGGTIKVAFGYKKGKENISNPKELAEEMARIGALGYSSKEEVEYIIKEMYEIIGNKNLVYLAPTHAKVLIIDDRYLCIGSHNWLSNAGKTKAKEGTRITTYKPSVDYAKKEFFE